MRDHPIPPVTDLFQYRAIGLVRGRYIPSDPEHFSRGLIIDENGEDKYIHRLRSASIGEQISLIRYFSK